MPIRKAEEEWKGNLIEGAGRLKVGSGAFDGSYSFRSRLEEGQSATNPEELIGAAHAGCFTMALTAELSQRESRRNGSTPSLTSNWTKLEKRSRSRALSFRRKPTFLALTMRRSRKLLMIQNRTVQCRRRWPVQKFA